MNEYEYIKRENLLDGISSPESDFDEVITNLIFEHKLDFLHDNDEDGVRDFANDLLVRVKNYIATEPAEDVVEAKWISVNEGLPEEDTRVLVYLDRNANPYTFFDTDRLKNGKWVRWNKCVTHWMPLPKPPKGGADNDE